jgi:hypothetical protein
MGPSLRSPKRLSRNRLLAAPFPGRGSAHDLAPRPPSHKTLAAHAVVCPREAQTPPPEASRDAPTTVTRRPNNRHVTLAKSGLDIARRPKPPKIEQNTRKA